MKKNKALRTAAGLMVATVLTIGMVSGTFAKYASEVDFNGSSGATVAKWQVKVNSQDVTSGSTPSAKFDLFSTIYDEDGFDYEAETGELPNQDEETDVDENGKKLIAPGTTGYINFKIENLSEVNITYSFKVTVKSGEEEEEKDLPLEFSLDDGETWSTGDKLAEDASVDGDPVLYFEGYTASGSSGLSSGDYASSIEGTLFWRWAFESEDEEGDKKDTELGILAQGGDLTLSVKLIIEQVD